MGSIRERSDTFCPTLIYYWIIFFIDWMKQSSFWTLSAHHTLSCNAVTTTHWPIFKKFGIQYFLLTHFLQHSHWRAHATHCSQCKRGHGTASRRLTLCSSSVYPGSISAVEFSIVAKRCCHLWTCLTLIAHQLSKHLRVALALLVIGCAVVAASWERV